MSGCERALNVRQQYLDINRLAQKSNGAVINSVALHIVIRMTGNKNKGGWRGGDETKFVEHFESGHPPQADIGNHQRRVCQRGGVAEKPLRRVEGFCGVPLRLQQVA